MIQFDQLTSQTFLSEYWQKKPLVIRQAIPNFNSPLSPDELAGLSLEEDVESRMVLEKPDKDPAWQLKRGPFSHKDFQQLPETHWTLLVQDVDKLIPEIQQLLQHFDFIPQWRVDDIMISFAALHGSVGPHYDNYDVFLYQALGRRRWLLTTQNCHQDNYLPNLELRIMQDFQTEEEIILEEGDMLYLPPHVGHYGISLSSECMTYSFGYRSYKSQELWDSLGEYLAANCRVNTLYKDPDWSSLKQSSEIPDTAIQEAHQLLSNLLSDSNLLKHWFGCFATRLESQREQALPSPLEKATLPSFLKKIKQSKELFRNPDCRLAYFVKEDQINLFINGEQWKDSHQVTPDLVKLIANHRKLQTKELLPFLDFTDNQNFLFQLWRLQWLTLE